MLDLADHRMIDYPSGKRIAYRKYCQSCNKDMGYKLKTKRNNDIKCKNCTHSLRYSPSNKEIDSNKNVNFSSFKVIDNKRYYKCSCVGCGVDRGFVPKYRWKTLCRSCAFKNKNKTYNTRVKTSCTQQGILENEFVGFKTSVEKQEREKFLAKKLHIECFTKADYTCICCNKRGGKMNAHHLNSWHLYPEQRFLLENLVCLCGSCHREFHAKYGYRNNTKKQFYSFIGR